MQPVNPTGGLYAPVDPVLPKDSAKTGDSKKPGNEVITSENDTSNPTNLTSAKVDGLKKQKLPNKATFTVDPNTGITQEITFNNRSTSYKLKITSETGQFYIGNGTITDKRLGSTYVGGCKYVKETGTVIKEGKGRITIQEPYINRDVEFVNNSEVPKRK